MRILFICGSLEPGRDGAGDQARRIASELIRQGHQVSAVSLCEPELSAHRREVQDPDGARLEVLRLPGRWRGKVRYNRLRSWVEEFRPDWVSLQFVGMGFQRYGLPVEMLWYLPAAVRSAQFHIMFQELWCGVEATDTWKVMVLGVVQRWFIRLMLLVLKPRRVFTNSSFYANELRKVGANAQLAPVCSNIPPDDWGEDAEWRQVVETAAMDRLRDEPGSWLVVGVFGTVYPCRGLAQLMNTVEEAAAQSGRRLALLIIGRSRGSGVEQLLQAVPRSQRWMTGPLSRGMINRAMRLVDLGVVTTDSLRLNKSSTSSAWLERGIPVLLSAKDDTYSEAQMRPLGAYQVITPEDVLRALAVKGQPFSRNRFREVVYAYSSLGEALPSTVERSLSV